MQDGSLSPVKAFFKNKWVRIILIIDVLALLAVIGVIVWNTTKVSTINFNIAPVDATISVNGNTNYTNGQYAITPGTYQITVSHENFETKTFTVNVEPHYVATLTAFLKTTDDNFEFYKLQDNYESYEKLKSIASKNNNTTTDQDTSAEQFISDFEQTLSIMQVLPIKGYVYADSGVGSSTAGFAIRDGRNRAGCEKIACLLVNYYGKGYEETVAEKIKAAGYNPTDYQILYERYK